MANEMRESNNNLKVSVDVAEAITGLKAVQREAKEATHALKELESVRAQAKSAEGYTVVLVHESWMRKIEMKKELLEFFPEEVFVQPGMEKKVDPRKTLIVYPSQHQSHLVRGEEKLRDLIEDGAISINLKYLRVILGALK